MFRRRRVQARVVTRLREDLCVGCGICTKVCPTQALTLSGRKAHLDLKKCIGCGRCAPVCPTGAIQPIPATLDAIRLNLAQLRSQIYMLTSAVNRLAERMHNDSR
jgi:ferredoxin